jgi:hypothetical protein
MEQYFGADILQNIRLQTLARILGLQLTECPNRQLTNNTTND